MAYDIYSQAERIKELTSTKRAIDSAIKNCKDAESYFNSRMANLYFQGWENTWERVDEFMGSAEASIDTAQAILTNMKTLYGFVFKYRWTVGKGGIASIVFDATASPDEITFIHETGASDKPVANGAGQVVAGYDKLLIAGTTSNDGILTVTTSSTDTAILVSDTLTSETCSTPGASVTLITRGA